MTSTNAQLFRAALFNACQELFAADTDPFTLVVRGLPAFATAQDNVCVGVVTTSQEFGAMGTTRQREETLTCQIDFYSFRNGGAEMEEVVEGRAWAMCEAVAEYLRVTNTKLISDAYPDGLVRESYLTDAASDAATDPDVLAKGRMHVVSATFTGLNRVRS